MWKLLYLEYRLELEYNSSFGILALKAVEWSKGEIVGDELRVTGIGISSGMILNIGYILGGE